LVNNFQPNFRQTYEPYRNSHPGEPPTWRIKIESCLKLIATNKKLTEVLNSGKCSEKTEYCADSFDFKRIGVSYEQFLKLRFCKKLIRKVSATNSGRSRGGSITNILKKYSNEIEKIGNVLRIIFSIKTGDALDFRSYQNLKTDYKFLKNQDTVILMIKEFLRCGQVVYDTIEEIQQVDYPPDLNSKNNWGVEFSDDCESTDLDFLKIAENELGTYPRSKLKWYSVNLSQCDKHWDTTEDFDQEASKKLKLISSKTVDIVNLISDDEKSNISEKSMDKKNESEKISDISRRYADSNLLTLPKELSSDVSTHPNPEKSNIPFIPLHTPRTTIDLEYEIVVEPYELGFCFLTSYQNYKQHPLVFKYFIHIGQTMIPANGALLSIHTRIKPPTDKFNITLPDELDANAVKSVIDHIHGFRIQLPPENAFHLLFTAACYFEATDFLASIDKHWLVRKKKKSGLKKYANRLMPPKFR